MQRSIQQIKKQTEDRLVYKITGQDFKSVENFHTFFVEYTQILQVPHISLFKVIDFNCLYFNKI